MENLDVEPPGLPDLLLAAENPLEAVLDRLLEAWGARYVVFVPAGAAAQRAVGRRPGGRPIARPERLGAAGFNGGFLEGRGRVVERHSRRTWRAAWPCCAGARPAGGLLASGPLPLPEALQSWPGPARRWAAWVELARRLEERRGHALPAAAGEEDPTPLAQVLEAAATLLPRPGTPGEEPGFEGIIARAPAMREVLRTAAQVAVSGAPVLLEGESGTGKELIARAIHEKSARAGGPFICENCAACPEGLLESEFFGVERGAFTGAHRTRPGLFELASGGTLFLDEIGEMDLRLQGKLLRALQERVVRRVGGSEVIPVDFRLLCATNRVLAEEARAGRFRADLLYRIEVVTIRLPPLRERREDIPALSRHFLDLHARATGVAPPPVDPEALRLLCEYSWPGNVRELENEMCRAVALGAPALTPSCLSAKIPRAVQGRRAADPERLLRGRSFEAIEREVLGGILREALRRAGGNKNRAAQLLGIPKTTFYRRLRRYVISAPAARPLLVEAPPSGPEG